VYPPGYRRAPGPVVMVAKEEPEPRRTPASFPEPKTFLQSLRGTSDIVGIIGLILLVLIFLRVFGFI
jgi:hypothetical protein